MDETGHRVLVEPVPTGEARPLWSVMIPTYHCARYLGQALASVLAQDPGPEVMQIEVVDDCSTQDDPESVVRSVGGGRVGFYRRPQNGGHTRNFETCLQRSRGHLVHLLHGDDATRLGFYEKLARPFAINPGLGAAFCRVITMSDDCQWVGISPLQQPQSAILPNLLERLAVKQRIQTPSIVVRREVYETLGGFDRRLTWTEDWEMWARVAARYPVWHEPEPLALYRVHASSNTGRYTRTGETLRDLRRLFAILETYLPAETGRRLCGAGRQHYAIEHGLVMARRFLRQRDFAAAATSVKESLNLSFSSRVVAAMFASIFRAALGAVFRPIDPNL